MIERVLNKIPVVTVHDMPMQTQQNVGIHVCAKASLETCATNAPLYNMKPDNDLCNSVKSFLYNKLGFLLT